MKMNGVILYFKRQLYLGNEIEVNGNSFSDFLFFLFQVDFNGLTVIPRAMRDDADDVDDDALLG